jgi:glycosyltransferase involved in cell wall biosynthesis
LGILNPGEYDPITARKIARHTPVVVGPDALTDLAAEADILVSWGIAHPDQLFAAGQPRPFHIAVSHGDGTSAFTLGTMRAAAPYTDRFVAVSQAAAGGIPAERHRDTAIIPNGIDPERLKPALDRAAQRKAWGVPLDAKVLGYLGRASEEKNPKALAAAVRRLPPEWVGVFVGDGLWMPEVQADAFAVAGTRVFFPGVVEPEAIGSALAAFDMLLVPSHQEGYCQSAVEGWMAGVPVVMTPVGVALERPEWVWPLPMNPDGATIARTVLRADLPSLRKVLPAIAAAASAEFGADLMAARWSAFLEECSACLSVPSA